MGVTYKLKEEVVQFIVRQRQGNPLFSCRQLAEAASEKFGLNLSKSSVHDVLKESGIITPRGRKPKDKFNIPQEKKKQIQASLSQIKLLPIPVASEASLIADVTEIKDPIHEEPKEAQEPSQAIEILPEKETKETKETLEISAVYEGAGRIFFRATLWDLGIYSEEDIKETDWSYYLTYCKGVKVVLENSKDFLIDLPLPIERCIREIADGLVNNVKPFILSKVSDEDLFKRAMEAQAGHKINTISIVDQNDHILTEFNNIMESKREYLVINRVFVENNEKNLIERSKLLFFPQIHGNTSVINDIFNLKGSDNINKDENIVTIMIDNGYDKKDILLEAADKLNGMYLRDDQNRVVKVQIQNSN